MPVCVVCSGSDFICESGFYFCSECQTQSQDVRQEINDNDNAEDEGQPLGGKRRRSGKSSDSSSTHCEENMTSWEGFNFALVGLVDELICLGANPKLKMVVLKLWSNYLRKMEVAFYSNDSSALPKLGPNFKKYDANIIYGYEIQKRKSKKEVAEDKNSFVESEENVQDSGLQRKRIQRNNKAAFRKTYDIMMHEMSTASQTLTDVTLEMLSVSAADIDGGPKELQFNTDGMKNKKLSGGFQCHPGLIVRNKLLCILYLGLLECDEKINLSDLLRWVAEGHLSYQNLSRFFPAEVQMNGENFCNFAAHQPSPSYNILLSATQHLAAYLGFQSVKVPPMKKLIQHYCRELNLPDQVCMLAKRLLDLLPKPSETPVSLKSQMPNWEGRAMAHILVALKLLFGLDDATEHRNSRIARRLNELITSQNTSAMLFVWDDWEHFCVLRRTAFMLHIESSYAQSKVTTSSIQNVDPFITIWKKKYRREQKHKRLGVVRDTYKHITSRLKDKDLKQVARKSNVSFPANLTPYSLYTEIIVRAYQEGKIKLGSSDWSLVVNSFRHDMLSKNFRDASVDYLTHPNEYIEWAQNHGLRIGLHSGSAVTSVNLPAERSTMDGLSFHRVKVFLDVGEAVPSTTLPLPSPCQETPQDRKWTVHKPLIFPKVDKGKRKTQFPMINDMKEHASPEPKQAPVTVKKVMGRPKLVRKSYDVLSKEDEDNMLHTPHTEYWTLHFPRRVTNFVKEAWRLPSSFLTILEDCASLLQMPPSVLYKEVIYVETLHKDLAESIANSFCPQRHKYDVHYHKKSW